MAFDWKAPRHTDGNYCVMPSDMRSWEKREIEEIPERGRELMEIAGREVAQLAMAHYPDIREVLIFCGPGNNGGDGLAAAWYFKRCGIDVHLFAFDDAIVKTPDAKFMFERVKELPRTIIRCSADAGRILEWMRRHDALVIDAIYGTGYRPAHNSTMTRVYQCIAELGFPVIAVDVPSGIDASTGYRGTIEDEAPPRALAADETVTFGAPKLGQFMGDGAAYCGRLYCVDIGLRPNPKPESRCLVLSDAWCARRFDADRRRNMDVHKGRCGHVLVIGGSETMPGAACLSARAALRSGCGLVTIGARERLRAADEVMTAEICSGGVLDAGRLSALTARSDCVLVGPGLGRDDVTHDIMSALEGYGGRLVIDADALWAISERDYHFSASEIYLTPHPAEAARLAHTTTREILYHPVQYARQIADRYGATTVLKSHVSLVAARGNSKQAARCALNPYPNPAMATAGVGDVFAGILSGILAQARSGAYQRWFDSFEVASIAVNCHSRAGRRAAEHFHNSMLAGDIIDFIDM